MTVILHAFLEIEQNIINSVKDWCLPMAWVNSLEDYWLTSPLGSDPSPVPTFLIERINFASKFSEWVGYRGWPVQVLYPQYCESQLRLPPIDSWVSSLSKVSVMSSRCPLLLTPSSYRSPLILMAIWPFLLSFPKPDHEISHSTVSSLLNERDRIRRRLLSFFDKSCFFSAL